MHRGRYSQEALLTVCTGVLKVCGEYSQYLELLQPLEGVVPHVGDVVIIEKPEETQTRVRVGAGPMFPGGGGGDVRLG